MTDNRLLALLAVRADCARDLFDALRHAGFRVAIASSGAAALRSIADTPDLSVLVASEDLPAIGGRELARHFLAAHPEGRVVLLSRGPAADEDRLVVLVEPVPPARVVSAARHGATG